MGSLALTACVSGGEGASANPTSDQVAATPTSSHVENAVVDPLPELTDFGSKNYLPEAANPVLHDLGSGSSEYSFSFPKGTKEIQYFVSCKQGSKFEVSTTKVFDGSCYDGLMISGQIPLSEKELKSGQVNLDIKIPDGESFWIVGIPKSK